MSKKLKGQLDASIVYVLIGGLLAFAFLAIGLFVMFKLGGNTDQRAQNAPGGQNGAVYVPPAQTGSTGINNTNDGASTTPTNTPTPTTSPTATVVPTDTADQEAADSQEYDKSYIYGTHKDSKYYIDYDKNQLIELSSLNVRYTPPADYNLISFATAPDGTIWFTVKVDNTNTYELRKLKPGQTDAGSLFWKYITTYTMRSFLLDPGNVKTHPVYIFFDRPSTKQVYILRIYEYKESAKKVFTIQDYANFKSLHKVKDQDMVILKYTDTNGATKEFTIKFE